MSLRDLIGFAGSALWGHRLRTVLSLTGMSIGVAAVILLTSLGEGARLFVTQQFSTLGSNLIIVIPGRNETTGSFPGVMGVPNDLTLQDAEAIQRAVPEVLRFAPGVTGTESIAYGERRRQVAVLGTTHEIMPVQGFGVSQGEFLPEGDLERGSSVAVLGRKTARELFREENAVGRTIRIGDRRVRVIGVLAEHGMQVGIDLNDIVFIPVATAMQIFNRSSLFRIIFQTHAHADIARAGEKIEAVLLERHGELDFSLLTQDAVVSTLGTILTVLTLALVAIAAVSLSVAGIGIMNVMLVSVSERTAEIGLLRALGVGRRQILGVFLAEAALLSTTGGAVGVLIGMSAGWLMRTLYPAFPVTTPIWAIVAAITVALGFGLVFGTLPARKATRLEPVEALARR